jgi:hypothetical protein
MSEPTFIGIEVSNWIMILAVIAGPILAIQIQKYIEGVKEAKERRVRVFKDLMATRASTLAYQHVVALNMVGLEFQGKSYVKVVNAWKMYLDHLSSFPNNDEAMAKVWAEKKNDQLSDLLYEMGTSLGFDFDKVHIKKAGYIPKAYADKEDDQVFIRRSLVEVFLGQRSIPLNIVSLPVDQEAVNIQKQLQAELAEHYKTGKPFPVKIIEDKG